MSCHRQSLCPYVTTSFGMEECMWFSSKLSTHLHTCTPWKYSASFIWHKVRDDLSAQKNLNFTPFSPVGSCDVFIFVHPSLNSVDNYHIQTRVINKQIDLFKRIPYLASVDIIVLGEFFSSRFLWFFKILCSHFSDRHHVSTHCLLSRHKSSSRDIKCNNLTNITVTSQLITSCARDTTRLWRVTTLRRITELCRQTNRTMETHTISA